jgi:hypothetical protein
MIVFDETSFAFIRKSEQLLRSVIANAGLTVARSRFQVGKILYPIHIVVFDGPELAHFNAPFYQIGLNRKLVYSAKESVLREILQHEFAHYLTFIEFGEVPSHGSEFHEICRRYGFPKEVSLSTMDLNVSNELKVGELEAERVLDKVKKLLQLAQSANVHEAEMATLKANELLLRHNLSFISSGDDDPIYLDRLLLRKRKDTKLMAIYEILRHFIVRPVLSQGKGVCCLEVSGTRTNVELARYVANFLDRELDDLWIKAKKEFRLQGLKARNSFYLGVASGFDTKMKSMKENFSDSDKKALRVIEGELDQRVAKIYRRLSSAASSNSIDGKAHSLGHESGKSLTIRKGVETHSAKGLYLPSP